MAKYNVHAGHCPDGNGASGAVGLIKESTEARKVKNQVIAQLKANGHTVYDCTCDTKETRDGCLSKIVKKCNSNSVDLDISIHLNAGRNDYSGDGSIGGSEVFCYNNATSSVAARICAQMKSLGYRDRGVKFNTGFYVLKNTKSPAILVECCFVDDKDDVKIWDAVKMGNAIASGILNKNVSGGSTSSGSSTPTTSTPAVNTSGCYKKYTGTSGSIDTVLKEIGVASAYYGSWSKRKPVADANGISGYTGTESQNNALISKAKSGALKVVGSVTESNTSYYKKYTGKSGAVDVVLKDIGVPSTHYGTVTKRKPIGVKNGFASYSGKGSENIKLISLAKQGKLKKV